MERLFKKKTTVFEQNLASCSTPLEGAQGYCIISALSLYINIYSHKAPSTLVSMVNEIFKPALQKNMLTPLTPTG